MLAGLKDFFQSKFRLLVFVVLILPTVVFLIADQINPLPDANRIESVLVVADDGTPLRAFADNEGVWRYPVSFEEVSPLYIQALLSYEDRWFYYHFGVNPFAMLRAVWQLLRYQRAISGGSTITMQVARILEPHSKDFLGKSRQIFRALQLELHYSKNDILTIYLNLAPYGGPIEGVQTASYAYLQKSALDLSHAEAALLAVLPQSPSRIRPDRHPERAQRYRDKVLNRMQTFGLWSKQTVDEAKMESVFTSHLKNPMLAPLLSRYLRQRESGTGKSRINTVLNSEVQWALEDILLSRSARFPPNVSAAVMVVENDTGYIRGYAGSTDFLSTSRFGQIDMIQAVRSPGSTLKPFLYGIALDDGLVHSESLLNDVPIKLGGYSPRNFQKTFQGALSVSEALQKSLNVPAVDMMERISADVFVARLRNAGLDLTFPVDAQPNLAMILGGAGARLEQLVRIYTAFAREGLSIQPRYLASDPVVERRTLSAGASWIIRDILANIDPPNGIVNDQHVAWKTGTSYGFRDAWAMGVTDRYTIGVWTGRPDGSPSPGRYGAFSAAPILFDVIQTLPQGTVYQRSKRPATVKKTDICWPLGREVSNTNNSHCHIKRKAWVLDQQVPPTLPSLKYSAWSAGIESYWVDEQGQRGSVACTEANLSKQTVAKWPTELYPWLDQSVQQKMQLPRLQKNCRNTSQADIEITQPVNGSLISSVQGRQEAPLIALQARGGRGLRYWWLNGRLIKTSNSHESVNYAIKEAGEYTLLVIDDKGGYDKVNFRVVDIDE